MHDPFGHDKALVGVQFNRALFHFDDKAPLQNKEKLIVVIVLVPVILALHDAEPHNRIIDLAQSLIIPRVIARFYQRGHINEGEGRELDVQAGGN